MSLLEQIEIIKAADLISASSSIDTNTSRIDTAGCDGIMFITTITDSAATGIATLTAQSSTADSDSAMAAITGASATATSATNDDLNDTLLIVDVFKPDERYVQGTLSSSTANIAYGQTIAIKYNVRSKPVTQGATVQASTAVIGS